MRAQVFIQQNRSYAQHRRLGYLSTCPSKVGTAMRVTARLKLPGLGKHSADRALSLICRDLGFDVAPAAPAVTDHDTWICVPWPTARRCVAPDGGQVRLPRRHLTIGSRVSAVLSLSRL